jgi:hypothetical protein
MGGGAPGPNSWPGEVWSPMGGPHCTPPNSYRRGALAVIAVLAVAVPLALAAAQREKRQLGVRPVFTERFSEATLDRDHPGWRARNDAYHANKPSFWARVWPDKHH